MNTKLLDLVTSQRFLVAAAGVVAVVASDLLGVTLSTDKIVGVATMVSALVLSYAHRAPNETK